MIKECQRCGRPFKPERITKKYCSDTCKQYAYLDRNGLKQASPVHGTEDAGQVQASAMDDEPTLIRKQSTPQSSGRILRPLLEKEKQQEQPAIKRKVRLSDKYRPRILQELRNRIHLGGSCFIKEYYRRWDFLDWERVHWVNERLKSYLRAFVRLAQLSRTKLETMEHLSHHFTKLLTSSNFEFLPSDYPYINFVETWENRLKRYVRRLKEENNLKFKVRLNSEYKIGLKQIICEIGDTVPDIDHFGLPILRPDQWETEP